jgi:hypothetical protein
MEPRDKRPPVIRPRTIPTTRTATCTWRGSSAERGFTLLELRTRSDQGFKWNRSLGSTATTIYTASDDFVAGAFGRSVRDTSALALTPGWIEQRGVGRATDTLRDSTAYDGWGRLIRWAPMRGRVLTARPRATATTGVATSASWAIRW